MRSALEDPAVAGPLEAAERARSELATDVKIAGAVAFSAFTIAIWAGALALLLPS
ncbi:hypothetical protein [Azospirillum himalayense]|uniref:Diacylglycerol kinase n=1 Tax=Azospirillum himalayense TaxID=654847 RepID=A0ABW0G1E7_9PROT